MKFLIVLTTALLGTASFEDGRVELATLTEERGGTIGKKPSSFHELEIALRVEGFKNARTYGNINVTEAKTNTGEDLVRRREAGKYYITNVKEFKVLSDYEKMKNRFQVDLVLQPSSRQAKTIDLKGTFDILIGGHETNIEFPNIRSLEGKTLEHKDFKASGLKITIGKPRRDAEKRIEYTVTGNSILSKITLVDAEGKAIKISGSGAAGSYYSSYSYWKRTVEPIPEDAKLRVTIFKDGKIKTIPFEFTNVDLP
ncbi:MAG: hypothetical protein ACFCD0_25260 [Gemmataceae bacterium]